ncbi:beta-glucoside-specific PTS transporter subunit IIABC [Gulosibacter molinativorax]|uniref:PTS beta-glucoside transporter subunit EIIBCA n=1 Tax=Gulosibacter molinativorax TaxID=256821 RepID=A0ABT7C8U2_9MICO|nr:beta-glucoside-specific PTS transporter subunit IIABC [Gulosibacter molinativorax]MDJ1371602.1 PTS beta-glucoside transporter subunit EIIBCA [Gulosibacter molinativorax]QUY61055.1 Beta-glucoside-specific phosphotransferase system enzyme II [Gulosibacter molinativorax]
MDYKKTADEIMAGIGGEENVKSLVHCATRLRFVLHDETKADDATVKGVDGVVTVNHAAGQYQVVIGNEVPQVYAAITEDSKVGESTGDEEPGEKGNLFDRFVRMVSAIFQPILWALAATGLLKAFVFAAATFGWLDTTSSTYAVLDALSGGFLHFLPMAIAITAARFFKAKEFTSLAIAAALVYPSVAALTLQPDLDFFGIPMTMISYASSVIPIIVVVWIQSYLERWLDKVLPASLRNFTTPAIVVLLLVPFTFLVVGPLSNWVSQLLAGGIGWLFETVPWIGGAFMGGLWQVLVMLGLHWGFVPLFPIEFEARGAVYLTAPIYAAVIAQAGAVGAVWLRTRNAERRKLAAPSTISAFFAGVTEPAVYGVNLPMKRPFAFGIVGGVVGGAIISAAGGAANNAGALPSFLALPSLIGNGNLTWILIGVALAFIVAFILTLLFGVKQVEDKEDAEAASAAASGPAGASPSEMNDALISSPLDGNVIPLSEVKDEAFAGGALGKGVAIQPTGNTVQAPFNGTVVMVFPTGHAIGLRDANGAEVLIHIGLNTVELDGEHFEALVEQNQEVQAGDPLIRFDREAIGAAGYDLTTPVLVTNQADYPEVANEARGEIKSGDPLYMALRSDVAEIAS